MEQAKETQGLNTVGYPNLDSGKEEKHQKKSGEISMEILAQLIVLYQCQCLSFGKCNMLCKMLTIGEAG